MFGRELQRHGGGERLGGAADAEPVLRLPFTAGCGVGHSLRAGPPPMAIAGLGEDAGNTAFGHGPVEGMLELGMCEHEVVSLRGARAVQDGTDSRFADSRRPRLPPGGREAGHAADVRDGAQRHVLGRDGRTRRRIVW